MPYKNPEDRRAVARRSQAKIRQRKREERLAALTPAEMHKAHNTRSSGTKFVSSKPAQPPDVDKQVLDRPAGLPTTEVVKGGDEYTVIDIERKPASNKALRVAVSDIDVDPLSQMLHRDVPLDDLFTRDQFEQFSILVRADGNWYDAARASGIPWPTIKRRMDEGQTDFFAGRKTWNAALYRHVDRWEATTHILINRTIIMSAKTTVQKVTGKDGTKKEVQHIPGDLSAALAFRKAYGPAMPLRGAVGGHTGVPTSKGNQPPGAADGTSPPSPQLLEAYKRISIDDIQRMQADLEMELELLEAERLALTTAAVVEDIPPAPATAVEPTAQ